MGAKKWYHKDRIKSRKVCACIGAWEAWLYWILIQKKGWSKYPTDTRTKNMTQENLSAKLQVRGCDITRSALAKIEVGQRHLYVDEIIHLKEIFSVGFEDILL